MKRKITEKHYEILSRSPPGEIRVSNRLLHQSYRHLKGQYRQQLICSSVRVGNHC